jgi:hypothetical protein
MRYVVVDACVRLFNKSSKVLKPLCHRHILSAIVVLPGHGSIQATGRYLCCKQHIRSAVVDRIGVEPEG